MGVEYGENSPSNERHEASYSREFLPTGGFACFLALYWGGIPRKEVGQRGSNPGVECGETPLFVGGMWRKTSHAKTWLTNCSLSRYSTSFLKWVHCPLSAAGCAQTSRFANLLHSIQLRLGKMPASYFMTAPVRPGRCRYLQNHRDRHLSPVDSRTCPHLCR